MSQELTLKQVPASSVPYGESICVRGGKVWVVLDKSGKILGAYPTAKAARAAHPLGKARAPEQELISRARTWGADSPSAKRYAKKHGLYRG